VQDEDKSEGVNWLRRIRDKVGRVRDRSMVPF